MDEDFSSVDWCILIEVLLRVIFREDVGCFLGEVFEDPAFVVLADEGLIIDVMELVIVLLGSFDLQGGDVLKGRWEGLIRVDVFLEVLPVFFLIVADVHDKNVAVDFPLTQGELLVALLKLLHLLATPT